MLWMGRTEIEEHAAVVSEGLYALTPVATPDGWTRAAALRAGSWVVTFDSGPRQIVSVASQRLDSRAPQGAWPLLVPPSVLGNDDPMMVLPEQGVMIDSDVAEELFGEPFVTVPASALDGWRGIKRVAPPAETVVQIVFDTPALIYASRDMILACPGLPMLSMTSTCYGTSVPPLGPAAARHLVACLKAADQHNARHLHQNWA